MLPFIILNLTGRFDLVSPKFDCKFCGKTKIADRNDHIASGFWPGLPSVGFYVFDKHLLEFWHHQQHESPGSSEAKFLKVLKDLSKDSHRVR